MKQIGTYTVTESWENDTLGNAAKAWEILKPYIAADNLGAQYNIYVAVYTNNQAQNTNYKADYIYYSGTGDLDTSYNLFTVRNNRTNRTNGASASRSFWASTGTVIKIYRLLEPLH